MPKSSILVSSDHNIFSQPSSESFKCLFTNFKQACICALLSRGILQAHDFSRLWLSMLLMVILVTVDSAALKSSTSSCCVVLGCSLIFLIIRFTPRWEILWGTPDQGRLMFLPFFYYHTNSWLRCITRVLFGAVVLHVYHLVQLYHTYIIWCGCIACYFLAYYQYYHHHHHHYYFYHYYFLLIRVFHISVSWWSFTEDWVTASLLKSPGLFYVFRPFSAVLSFG